MKNFILILSCLVTTLLTAGDELRLKGISAYPQYPLTGKVSIFVSFQGKEEDVKKTDCKFVATIGATNTLLPSSHITPEGEPFGEGTAWTRKFLWDALADVGPVKIGDVELKVEVEASLGGIQLWEDGPCWSECNVGATSPEDAGYYFLWGETIGYIWRGEGYVDTDGVRAYSRNASVWGHSKMELEYLGYIDSMGNLRPEYDAATAHLGSPWKMPTKSDYGALIRNCTVTFSRRNGVLGAVFSGKGKFESQSIFLPLAGSSRLGESLNTGSWCYYGSSTLSKAEPSYGCFAAWVLYGSSSEVYSIEDVALLEGDVDGVNWTCTVRPLRITDAQTSSTRLELDCEVEKPEAPTVGVTVTNIVVHYVVNSVRPEFAVPVTKDAGFVNVITEVVGNNVAVPQTWTENYPLFSSKFGSDFTQALVAKSGKRDASGREMLVWEDYVAGTDPTNPNDKFKASVTMVEGRPVVSWTPELDAERAALRKYTVYGKVKLTDSNWAEVGKGDEEGFNFFKVTVEMK